MDQTDINLDEINMKKIITEEQRDRLMIIRRLRELKSLIPNLYPFYYPCDFDSLESYMMAMKIEMFQTLTLDWFESVDKDLLWDMITEVYRDEMVDNYISNCKKHITEDQNLRLFKIMKNLMLEKFPELELPLVKKNIPSISNRGYGSGLDDYYLITTSYKDEDGETWFKEFDDRDIYQESKWEVNEKMELLYDMFGEELFMDFVKHYFNINLKDKGNLTYDWVLR